MEVQRCVATVIATRSDKRHQLVLVQRQRAVSPLAEAERETLEEGREWTRKRLEKKLQRLADSQGAISPPSATGG